MSKGTDKIFNSLLEQLQQDGEITIKTANFKIVHVKSIAQWGRGIFYGFRRKQKTFSKSIPLSHVILSQ